MPEDSAILEKAVGEQFAREFAVDEELKRLFPLRKVRKVLLVQPPDVDASLFDFSAAKRGRCYNYPMYGSGVVASWLVNSGIEVKLANLNHEILKQCAEVQDEGAFDFDKVWKENLDIILENFQPDLIGVTCMFTQTHEATVQVCQHLKSLFPETPLALGGVHITNSYINSLNGEHTKQVIADFKIVDLFFLYESETAFDYFVKAANGLAPVEGIYQVHFNTASADLSFVGRQNPEAGDLNVLPSYQLMNISEMSEYGVIGSFNCLREPSTRFATVLSNRGCRAQCTFCSVRNFNGKGVRIKEVQCVIDEMKILKNDYGIDHIMWLDDDLLFDHKRVLHLFNEMVRQDVGLTWDCTNGVIAASCTDEIVHAASESGCLGMNIGMESGNPEILKRVKKPGRVQNFLKAAETFRKYPNINVRVFLIIGFPNESYSMIQDTVNVSKEMGLDWYNITILQPLPNTPIFDSMVQLGLIDDVDAKEIRYNSGPYGKHKSAMQNRKGSVAANPLANADPAAIPSGEELQDIWMHMNFELNFKPLLTLDNPIKLDIQLRYLRYITEMVAPEDPFPMYFRGRLQMKIGGSMEQSLFNRLQSRLAQSEYWPSAFEHFGLSLEHLAVA